MPALGDILIGTDASDSNATKNFSVGDLFSFWKSTLSRGSFYHNVTQTAAAINTAYAMRFASTDTSNTSGFSIANDGSGNPTRITAANTGNYNLAFSAQLSKTGGTENTIDIWLRVNGVDVPSTNTTVTLKANANYVVAAWNFFVSLTSGQYAEIMWATTDTNSSLLYAAATGLHPATPSVIATINQV